MFIAVGSTNPVKINAVINAASETWPEVVVKGFSVASGVTDQPKTDQETEQGAINRARNVLTMALKSKSFIQTAKSGIKKSADQASKQEILAVGLEGGVFQQDDELWSTVWAAVVDVDGKIFTANGARFKVPKIITEAILAGEEMGLVCGKLVSDPLLKHKNGMLGLVTKNFIDRTEEYSAIVKLALGLWYGRNWVKEIN
ncbi:MAG: inosine/xanthosine triphosphatase [Candidatus Woesebacteria bacterium]|jgi:non-canonical (house-cleaning) NTP pyrophosphatase